LGVVLSPDPSATAFLAGAGISMPPPSALPSAAAFVQALADVVTDDDRLKSAILERAFAAGRTKRFAGDYLRFEAVMGGIDLAVDSDLDILHVFSDCRAPNAYHFYLARQLAGGAIILTTNFDNLIEIACLSSGVPYSLIVSEDDLSAFTANPECFHHPIIKLHGGHDLIEPGLPCRTGPVNVKTTLAQVARVYLRSSVDNLTAVLGTVLATRDLVVLGYSGSDDFDVMPCLMAHRPVHRLTWIDHRSSTHDITSEPLDGHYDLPPYRLRDLYKGQADIEIVRGDTKAVLAVIGNAGEDLPPFDWTPIFEAWSRKHLNTESHRGLLLGLILHQIERFDACIQVLKNVSEASLSGTQAELLNFVRSCTYVYLNDSPQAILALAELVDSDRQIVGLSLKGFAYYNLARINTTLARYTEARMYLNAALKVFRRQRDVLRIGDCMHEQGRIDIESGDYESALSSTEWSVRVSEEAGDLSGTANSLLQRARVRIRQGLLDGAEPDIRRAIEIFTLSGNQVGLGTARHAMGYLLATRGDCAAAAREFQEAIAHERSVGAKMDLAHSLHSSGDMYIGLGELEKARECLLESLQLKRELGDREGIRNSELLLATLSALTRTR
jgi:tetratricopeptide (TPR) repeat protein